MAINDCSEHGSYVGYECPRCEARDRHRELKDIQERSLEQASKDQKQRETEEMEQRWRDEEAEANAQQRHREANVQAELQATGKLKAREDVEQGLLCLRQGDLGLATRKIDGALEAWPAYAWGWLAKAEVAVTLRHDPSPMLQRAASSAALRPDDAVRTLPIHKEFARHLNKIVCDPSHKKLVQPGIVEATFAATLHLLDTRGAVTDEWSRTFRDKVDLALLAVSSAALVRYAGGVARFLANRGPRQQDPEEAVFLLLRLAGELKDEAARSAAVALFDEWTQRAFPTPTGRDSHVDSLIKRVTNACLQVPWLAPGHVFGAKVAAYQKMLVDLEESARKSAQESAQRHATEKAQRLAEVRRSAKQDQAIMLGLCLAALALFLGLSFTGNTPSASARAPQPAPVTEAPQSSTPPSPSSASAPNWLLVGQSMHHHQAPHIVYCEPGGVIGAVTGTRHYALSSSICAAAVHAGLLSRESGGSIELRFVSHDDAFRGSTRNGVTSASSPRADLAFTVRRN